MNTSLPTISYYEYLFEISHGESPTRLMYGWSKWGGASKGMVQGQSSVWYCQSCKREMSDLDHGFMFPMFDREFGKVCQNCLDEGIKKRIRNLWDLMRLHRVRHGIFD